MTFPYYVWVIVLPEGGHCPFLIRSTRKECIDAFNAWHGDPWPKMQRKGWSCQKMEIRPANK